MSADIFKAKMGSISFIGRVGNLFREDELKDVCLTLYLQYSHIK